MKSELSVDERQSLVDELRLLADKLVFITVQIAGTYGKTEPITKDADDATRAVRKLIYAIENSKAGTNS